MKVSHLNRGVSLSIGCSPALNTDRFHLDIQRGVIPKKIVEFSPFSNHYIDILFLPDYVGEETETVVNMTKHFALVGLFGFFFCHVAGATSVETFQVKQISAGLLANTQSVQITFEKKSGTIHQAELCPELSGELKQIMLSILLSSIPKGNSVTVALRGEDPIVGVGMKPLVGCIENITTASYVQ